MTHAVRGAFVVIAAVGLGTATASVGCGSETFVSADAGIEAGKISDAGTVDVETPPSTDAGDADPCASALFCQSFEASTEPGDGFTFVSATGLVEGAIKIDWNTVFRGMRALQINVPGPSASVSAFVARELQNVAGPVSLRFAYRFDTLPSATLGVARLVYGSDQNSLSIELSHDGTLLLKQGATVLTPAGPKLSPAVWAVVELVVDVAGKKATVRVASESHDITFKPLGAAGLSRLDVGPLEVPSNAATVNVHYDDVLLGR